MGKSLPLERVYESFIMISFVPNSHENLKKRRMDEMINTPSTITSSMFYFCRVKCLIVIVN